MSSPSPAWVITPRPLPHPRLRLICLPHAGAGASAYFSWAAALQPDGIEVRSVQYPGRETRLGEVALADAGAMTRSLADAWPALAGGGPCALFGHSMGALLAYELAAELMRRGVAATLGRLFLSGRNPPGTPPRLPPIHQLPDGEFIREIAARYGNLPPEILAEPEMVALITPILRADFRLVDTYAPGAHPALALPLSILGGVDDPWTSADELAGWAARTRGACRVRLLPGGHFFPQTARAAVLDAIRADLAQGLA
jgi:medium-chain acyl-[acyl-carrier-protein] hydrolase